MPSLIRDRDGEGFSGSRVESYNPDTVKIVGHEPIVGCCLLVGSVTAGTYSNRDWWITTPITEILSENDEEIKFLTANSAYTFKK